MSSDAQVLANRMNARRSTGPRTAEGKAAVSQNAVKHGLLARADVIRGEDQEQFDGHREALLAELSPAGAMESVLAERVVSLSWRLKRAERLQGEAFDALLSNATAGPFARLTRSLLPKGPEANADGEADPVLGQVLLKDFSNSRVLDRLLVYERRIENSFFRTLAELQKLRLVRELDPPAPESPAQAPARQNDSASCKTKPIQPERSDASPAPEAVPGDDAKQSQSPQAPFAKQSQSAGLTDGGHARIEGLGNDGNGQDIECAEQSQYVEPDADSIRAESAPALVVTP